MKLTDLVAAYAAVRDIAPGTAQQLGYAVRSFERHLGREATAADLTTSNLNAWIDSRKTNGRQPATIKSQRGALITLSREAFELSLLAAVPSRVKPVRCPVPMPIAWRRPELRRIVAAIDRLPGDFPCGLRRAVVLRAFALTAYYSGLRPCDLYALKPADIDERGRVWLRQQKTGEPVLVSLPKDALAAIAASKPTGRDRVFPLTKKAMYYWWRRIKIAARVKGSPKWFRRTGATHVERRRPGSAMSYLAHKTPGLAWRHYIDQRQLLNNRPRPPRIA